MESQLDNLAEQAKNGDKPAEEELFRRLFVRFRYLTKRRIGETDADDMAQEACATVAEKYKGENFTVCFTAWAYGVLKMKIGNHMQGRKRSSPRDAVFDEAIGSRELNSTKRNSADILLVVSAS